MSLLKALSNAAAALSAASSVARHVAKAQATTAKLNPPQQPRSDTASPLEPKWESATEILRQQRQLSEPPIPTSAPTQPPPSVAPLGQQSAEPPLAAAQAEPNPRADRPQTPLPDDVPPRSSAPPPDSRPPWAGPGSTPPSLEQAVQADDAGHRASLEKSSASPQEVAPVVTPHASTDTSASIHESPHGGPIPSHVTTAVHADANSSTPAQQASARPSAAVAPDAGQEALLGQATSDAEEYDATQEARPTPLRAAKVPSSRIARLLHYGSLGAGMAFGAAGSYLRGGASAAGTDGKGQPSAFMSEANVRRLVDKLSTMRGAALKLGQFMSIQDSNMLPEQIEQVLLRVQNSAHYMPSWQLEKVMREDLGAEWRSQFESFSDVPFAAASIGQVHAAVLAPDHPSPLRGQKVAVKVQFPGVRESIGSDLSNLSWLVTASALLPKGLFLDNTIRVMRGELDDECDYVREADMCRRFGSLLEGSTTLAAPRVVDELSTARVLTTEMMKGRPLTQAGRYSQARRDQIAQAILELSLRELFNYRLMQTDPNWTNFLFNERTGKIELLDFGATREYSKAFMDKWLIMLRAAVGGRREECIYWSERMGYLTGKESQPMRDAHVDSMIALGEPFRSDAPDPYPFAQQTITERVRAQIPLMLRERLTPPPRETYSLNRKLSGAFLLCARLRANVSCRRMLDEVTSDYVVGDLSDDATPGYAQEPARHGPAAAAAVGRRSLHTSAIRRRQTPTAATEVGLQLWRGTSPFPSSRTRKEALNLGARFPRHAVPLGGLAGMGRSDTQPASAVAEPRGEVAQASSSGDSSPMRVPTPPPSSSSSPAGSSADPATTTEPPGDAPEGESRRSTRGGVEMPKVVVRGVVIPGKPLPPGPEDCCMSGCAHCVYDDYAEALSDFHHDVTSARAELLALRPAVTRDEWRDDVLGRYPAEDVGGGAGGVPGISTAGDPTATARAAAGTEDDESVSGVERREQQQRQQREDAERRAERDVDAVLGALDPSMRAFLEMERKLKRKQKEQERRP